MAQGIIVSAARTSIPDLAARSRLSLRQFERKFTRKIDIQPKLFARIARFEAALVYKAKFSAKPWASVAQIFGYYDQVHMIHDFAEFTERTPSEKLNPLEKVFVETDPVSTKQRFRYVPKKVLYGFLRAFPSIYSGQPTREKAAAMVDHLCSM